MSTTQPIDLAEPCWKRIGVRGDASCEHLARYGHCRNCDEYARIAKSLFDREVPCDELRETTIQLAGDQPAKPGTTVSFLVFRIQTEWLALPTQYFQEVVDPRTIHVVPFRSNQVFKGLVNINGELLPCFSVGDLLQLAPEPGDEPARQGRKSGRLVVFAKDRKRYVFPAHEILGVRQLALDVMDAPPSTLGRCTETFTRRVMELEDRAIGWLDEEKLCSALERSLAP
jgi:chemotaxis-related protein WspD